MRVWRPTLASLWAAVVACACATSAAPGRMSSLEQRHAQQVQRLEYIKAEIRLSETMARKAKAVTQYEVCRARRSKIDAQIAARESQCLHSVARANQCQAQKSKSTSNGCLLGVVAAVVTGGAAGPWALGGCAAGAVYGEATEGTCAFPVCVKAIEEKTIALEILSESGLDEMPRCLGDLGLSFRNMRSTASKGILVVAVGNHSTADEAGMRKGDIIVGIRKAPIASSRTIQDEMRLVKDGDLVAFAVVRDGVLYRMVGHASQFNGYGKIDDSGVWVGIQHSTKLRSHVEFLHGVSVAHVSEVAEGTGIREGDTVTKIGGHPVRTEIEALERLEQFAPFDEVEIVVQREKQKLSFRLVMPQFQAYQ